VFAHDAVIVLRVASDLRHLSTSGRATFHPNVPEQHREPNWIARTNFCRKVDTFLSKVPFLDKLFPWMPSPTGKPLIDPSYPASSSIHSPTSPQNPLQQVQHRRSYSGAAVELQNLGTHSQNKAQRQQRAENRSIHASDAPESAHLLRAASFSSDFESSDTDPQMSKRNAKTPKEQKGPANSSATMSNILEHRRRHGSIDLSSPAGQAASLMQRPSFTLDDAVPELDKDREGQSKGFSELSKKDQRNFLLLVLLYFLQGIPMGLAMGSVPFLLKKADASYSAIGVFSLAAYPYSLKLLWSPIVDAVWSPKLGRRKSWILPIQTVSGFSMLWLGSVVNRIMDSAAERDGSGIWNFTFWWFALVFLCATQDIAVDGKIACGQILD
jgi:PAT family acetyl-CoA transporter-like MFS transporter 1